MAEKKERKRASVWLVLLRAALTACAVNVLLVMAFAFVLKNQWLGMDSIRFVNPAFKIVSAVIAAFITARRADSRAPLWAALAGAAYMAISFLVFSLLSGSFAVSGLIFADLGMCLLAGAVTGMIVNLKR